MRTVVTAEVVKRCPFYDEVDTGTATLTWDGYAPELHTLAARLASYRDVLISHEDFTSVLVQTTGASVVTAWRTAGLTVEVFA